MSTSHGTRSRWAAAAALLTGVVMAPAPAGATDDALFAQQWNLTQIGAPAAWATSTGAGVTIGIVDTGIDASHPEFAGKIVAQANCVGGPCREGTARDVDGHGTAVAGIAAAKAGNGVGIAGVAPDAQLLVAKALDDDGSGTTVDINNAIRWVVDKGAKVVNLSLGDADQVYVSLVGTSLQSGIEYAWSRGAIPVLASGNYERGVAATGSFNYGGLDAVVVGATTPQGGVAAYSTDLGNAKWGVVAPGGNGRGGSSNDVLSPARGARYSAHAGTSMATPHVSGTLALLLAKGLSPSEAVQRLIATADGIKVRADTAVAAEAAVAAPPVTAPVPPAGGGGGGVNLPIVIGAAVAVVVGLAGAAVGVRMHLSRAG